MIRDPKKSLNSYARYSGMALQMLVIILAGLFAGYKADQLFHSRPLLTILLTLAGVILAIYFFTRDLIRK